MRPDPEMVPVLIDTAKSLKASQRRLFMAKTVAATLLMSSSPLRECRTGRLAGRPSILRRPA